MTEVTANPVTGEPERGDLDRNLALLNYGLLFASVIFAGMPGMVAVVIAYSQRAAAAPAIRQHYNYQIRIFWIAVILTVVAALSALAAMAIGVGQLFHVGFSGNWDAWDSISLDSSEVVLSPQVVALLLVTAAASISACLWLLLAPLVGFIRLASRRGMGDRAA